MRSDRQSKVERVGVARVEGEVSRTTIELAEAWASQYRRDDSGQGEGTHLEDVGECYDPVEHVEQAAFLEHQQAVPLLFSPASDAPAAVEVSVRRVEERSLDLEERRVLKERLGLGEDGRDCLRWKSAVSFALPQVFCTRSD